MRSSLLRSRRHRHTAIPTRNSSAPPPTYAPSRLDVNLSRLANATTACTLLLAAFGYFYTVRPVFQNQKLQEDNARLELASAREQKILAELRERQSEVQQKIAEVDAALINAQKKVVASDERARVSEGREKAAKQAALLAVNREQEAIISAKNAAEKMAIELEHLDTARRTILVANFAQAVGFRRLRQNYDFIDSLYKSDEKKDGAFIVNSTALFLSPTKILEGASEDFLKAQEKIPSIYLEEVKKAVADEVPITCVIPDTNELLNQYSQRHSKIDELSSEDAHAEIERQRVAAEKSNSRLVVTTRDIKALKISYEVGRRHSLEKEFHKHLTDADSQCNSLLQQAMRRIINKVGPKKMAH